jgi:hypothetical protein
MSESKFSSDSVAEIEVNRGARRASGALPLDPRHLESIQDGYAARKLRQNRHSSSNELIRDTDRDERASPQRLSYRL